MKLNHYYDKLPYNAHILLWKPELFKFQEDKRDTRDNNIYIKAYYKGLCAFIVRINNCAVPDLCNVDPLLNETSYLMCNYEGIVFIDF